DNRKVSLNGIFRDQRFTTVGERANHSVASIVGTQDGRHGFERADVKKIEQKGRRDVVRMMTERDLGAAFFDRDVVENATTQTRADRAVSLTFGHQTFDD